MDAAEILASISFIAPDGMNANKRLLSPISGLPITLMMSRHSANTSKALTNSSTFALLLYAVSRGSVPNPFSWRFH